MITPEIRHPTADAGVRNAWRRTILALPLLAAVACGGGNVDQEGRGGAAPSSPQSAAGSSAVVAAGHNLLLITLDTTRADRLGAYGYADAATPQIDRLAAEGVRFERVTTTVPVTLPAHASILTGLQPFQHGVRNNGAFLLRDDAVTLAETLRDAGYSTGGFIAAVVLEAQFGIAQGFQHYDGLATYQAQTGDESGERPAGAVVDAASAWIRAQDGPWFAWVHMYDPHYPYEPPEPFASRHADPYDGEIAYVDSQVGRLRALLDETGAAADTLIVLTADHGEGLGDHGEKDHSFFVYDATVRVPLIVWAPGAVPAGATARGGAAVVDIVPTALSLLAVDAPAAGTISAGQGDAPVSGVDLSPRFLDPGAAGAPAYAESFIPYLDFGWSELRALVEGDFKYIAAPEPELYDLAADPGEVDNLVDIDVDRADAMAERLAALVEGDDVSAATGVAVDADNVAALQALGYLAGGGGGVPERRDIDPKDMVDTYQSFIAGLEDTRAALAEGRFGDANEILVRLDELIPDHYLVYFSFGELAYEAGDPATAVGVLERALDLNPSYMPTYIQLANALHANGQSRAARELIAQAQGMFPDNFTLTLLDGAVAHDTGNLDAALVAYRTARQLEPDNPRLLERMGHLFLLRGQPRDALAVMQRLVEITPDSATVWAQLAIGRAQTGDAAGAREAIARAAQLDPNDPLVQQVMQQIR